MFYKLVKQVKVFLNNFFSISSKDHLQIWKVYHKSLWRHLDWIGHKSRQNLSLGDVNCVYSSACLRKKKKSIVHLFSLMSASLLFFHRHFPCSWGQNYFISVKTLDAQINSVHKSSALHNSDDIIKISNFMFHSFMILHVNCIFSVKV